MDKRIKKSLNTAHFDFDTAPPAGLLVGLCNNAVFSNWTRCMPGKQALKSCSKTVGGTVPTSGDVAAFDGMPENVMKFLFEG